MVNEIRIYIEGGAKGNNKHAEIEVRRGFNSFFRDLIAVAQDKRIRWRNIPCGSRDATYKDFRRSLRANPDSFNVLLVDSEAPVDSGTTPLQHLTHRDKWDLQYVDADQCHLMVQVMEAWLIADIEALKDFYTQAFNSNSIPANRNVEEIEKARVYSSLVAATRNTKPGEYHKIRHGPKILALLNVTKVRKAAAHCERLFSTLEEKLNTS
ncbi:MAG: DUF4276 family protein [Pyrinomonadaceae bacterium]|nr:DUF4276 family protein [Pyrinomonadaceae bacterium]